MRKLQIQGHRSGFKPDNVLSSFQKSIDGGLEAIEIDVWLSADGHLLVMHGGEDGNLKDYGMPEEYIFLKTLEELRQLDAGNGEKIPLLSELFELIKPTPIFVNIELKGPRTPALAAIYDYHLAAKSVLECVKTHKMHDRFLVSSFNHHDLLVAMEQARINYLSESEDHTYFDVIYLQNYHNEPLPEIDFESFSGDGFNVSANHISQEFVESCRMHGLKVGVWIRKRDFEENDTFYEEMLKIGVDFICSDYPIRAMEIVDECVKN